MTKTQFITQLRADVDRFSAWWDKMMKEDRAFTEALPEADWFEQFMMFCDDDGVEQH